MKPTDFRRNDRVYCVANDLSGYFRDYEDNGLEALVQFDNGCEVVVDLDDLRPACKFCGQSTGPDLYCPACDHHGGGDCSCSACNLLR